MIAIVATLISTVFLASSSAASQQAEPPPDTTTDESGDSYVDFSVAPVDQPVIGGLLTWEYTVSNRSSQDLVDIVIDDGFEGRVCLIDLLASGQSETCTVTTVAGYNGYETVASVRGHAIGSEGFGQSPLLAQVTRAYVIESETVPNDLAFVDPPDAPDGTAPAWPIDRWGPYAISAIVAAAVIAAGVRGRALVPARPRSFR